MNGLERSRYDVIVVGGGPAGATAAILLAQQGQRVAVVEKAAFPRRKVCGEFVSATTWPLLHELGVANDLIAQAGPAIHRVGVFAGTSTIATPMAHGSGTGMEGGRAVSRALLDTVLLRHAAAAGATLWQPWTVTAFSSGSGRHSCTVESREKESRHILDAPLLVAAHGSWEMGPLPTQQFRKTLDKSDLLGFKAHFRGASLAADLMPLIAFPGGYGGLVNCGADRVSLSCCIRCDRLEAVRSRHRDRTAGDAVLAHILEHCTGVADVLSAATCEDAWLGAGPIRPGIRGFGRDAVFAVGNAAAEAHPVVAEGISIAIQSAMLLCEALRPCVDEVLTPATLAQAQRQYERAWRRNFAARLHASALYAQIFTRTLPTQMAVAVMKPFPCALRIGAAWSGKTQWLRHVQPRYCPPTIAPSGE